MTQRFCKVCRGWHDLARPWPDECLPEMPQRSELAFPMHIRDEMEPTEHPHDGREYTSKSAFRRVTRANGYIEVGNDPQRFKVPSATNPDRKEIRASLQKAAARLNA